jgi:DNA-binding LacI/PurR family transcriptional regulator
MGDLVARAYHEILQLLQRSYGRGHRLPSERRLAALFGVSQTVIHRAFKRLEAEHVIEAVPRHGYFVAHGGTLQGERNQYGLYLHENVVDLLGAQNFLVRVVVSLRKHLRERHCALLALGPRRAVAGRLMVEFETFPEEIPWNHLDGLFVLLSVEDHATLASPDLRRGPVLVLDQDATALGLDSVVFDDEGAGAWAARHLLELSHQRFAVIEERVTPHRSCDAAWLRRRLGFEQTVLRQGGVIDPDWRLPYAVFGSNAPSAGTAWQRRLRALLARKPAERPSAIFCPDGGVMADVGQFLRTHQVPAPKTFSLIGIGSESSADPEPYGRPPTMLVVSPEEMGRRAIEAMQEVLRLGPPGAARPARSWPLPPRFLKGETTAVCSR